MSQICSNDQTRDPTSDLRESPHQTAPVRPTDASSHLAVRCVGHIDRRVERCGDNPARVVKVIARKVHFLAIPAIAKIRVDLADWRQILPTSYLTQVEPS